MAAICVSGSAVSRGEDRRGARALQRQQRELVAAIDDLGTVAMLAIHAKSFSVFDGVDAEEHALAATRGGP